jgi:hypothetical protein
VGDRHLVGLFSHLYPTSRRHDCGSVLGRHVALVALCTDQHVPDRLGLMCLAVGCLGIGVVVGVAVASAYGAERLTVDADCGAPGADEPRPATPSLHAAQVTTLRIEARLGLARDRQISYRTQRITYVGPTPKCGQEIRGPHPVDWH